MYQKVIVVFIDGAVRLAPEETSGNLTGYEHNAVTCIGMKTDIPVNALYTRFILSFQYIIQETIVSIYMMCSTYHMKNNYFSSFLFPFQNKFLGLSSLYAKEL